MHVLLITPEGDCRCLFTDKIPLADLGRLEVERASTVEFNPHLQRWEVWTEQHGTLYRSESREACLNFEHDFFNRRLLEQ